MANIIIREEPGLDTRVSIRKHRDGTVTVAMFEQVGSKPPVTIHALLTADQAQALGITNPQEF